MPLAEIEVLYIEGPENIYGTATKRLSDGKYFIAINSLHDSDTQLCTYVHEMRHILLGHLEDEFQGVDVNRLEYLHKKNDLRIGRQE